MSITTNACFPFGRVLTSKSSIHGGCSMGMIIVLFEAIQKVIFVRGKMYNLVDYESTLQKFEKAENVKN